MRSLSLALMILVVCLGQGALAQAPKAAVCAASVELIDARTVPLVRLRALTPGFLRAEPLLSWPLRTWGLAARSLTDWERLRIRRYILAFEKDLAGPEKILRKRFPKPDPDDVYLTRVEDNVMSCYLMLWQMRDEGRSDEDIVTFALERLRRMESAPHLLMGNGRVVYNIGKWIAMGEPERFPEYLEVVRRSPWASVESEKVFPRPLVRQ